MSGISKVFAGEIVEEGKKKIKEDQLYMFVLVIIELECLCPYSIGCLRKVGRHPTAAAQTHEGGGEEAEEQRSAPQQQIQADPFSLRVTSGDGQWLDKKDVVVTVKTPQPRRRLR